MNHYYYNPRNHGFALVATVSMMVLMTLIAIGMLSLSTIEQRSSGGGSNEADRTARANARMALMIALGELQKAAGPDQRVTATASIIGSVDNKYTNPDGDSPAPEAANGRKHWVGIWDTSKVRRDVNGDGDINDLDKTFDTNGDGEGDEFPPYSPADPDKKEFVRWLVSGDTNNTRDNLDSLTAVRDAPSNNDVLIFEGLSAIGLADPNGENSVKVPKVEVATSNAGNTSYYAYWVEDEGVKTDLAWYGMEMPDPNAKNDDGSDKYPLGVDDPAYKKDRKHAQHTRLSSAAGPNYWLTNVSGSLGPYRDPNNNGAAEDAIATNLGPKYIDVDGEEVAVFPFAEMEKVFGLNYIPMAAYSGAGDPEKHELWLKGVRHRMTYNSRGVFADVKQGGLRRDLSLAFEMDGDDDVDTDGVADADTDILGNFNQQVGEFVGGSDKYASPYDYPAASGLPRARYLFREARDTGGPFADKIHLKTTWVAGSSQPEKRKQSVARGPTWWNLRDYYNLYKRMEKSGSNYRIKARAYYPDRSTIGYDHGELLDTISTWADHRDTDYRNPHQGKFAGQWKYVFRPARPNYAPVFLGTTAIISVTGDNYDPVTQTAEITLTLDPIFYFWNPYNREVEVDNLMVHFDVGLSGTVNILVTDTASGNTTTYSPDLWELLSCNFFNYQERSGYPNYGFLINESAAAGTSPFVLAPGEVVAASPSSNSGQSYLGYDPLNNASGIFMSSVNVQDYNSYWRDPTPYRTRQVRASVVPGATSINVGYHNPTGSGGQSVRHYMDSSLAPAGTVPSIFRTTSSVPGNQLQHTHMQLTSLRNEYRNPQTNVWPLPKDFNTLVNFDGDTGAFLGGVKQQFGLFTYLMKPANWSGLGPNAAEVFSRFNPAPMVINKDWWAAATPNMVFNFIADGTPNNLVSNYGLNFSTSPRNAFWGEGYDSSGQTSVPMSNIPSSPLISLVDFGHATLGTMAEDPFHSVGNSLPSPVISPVAPYGTVYTGGGEQTYGTGTDLSWLINDALFDRYFLSGIAPEYDYEGIGGTYRQTESLSATIKRFYGIDPSNASLSIDPNTSRVSPVMEAYLPAGKTRAEVVAELLETDLNEVTNDTPGYKKMAAYSLQKGSFNINCTDANTWGRFLRGVIGDLEVDFTDGTTDSRSGYLGFPSSSSPTPIVGTGKRQTWSGWSRLGLGGEINNLASNLANEVKKRGPFMSVSDFVNRKVGDTNGDGVLNNSDITDQHRKGAIQAAIDTMTTNTDVYSLAGGITTDYSKHSPLVPSTTQSANTATGIPGSVTQANVLRLLAPRISARSDTFRIRAYGEVRDADDKIIASAMCEAVVQRLPEYVDDSNEPWDEGGSLNATNQKYGRRFEIHSFRWLDENEI
jgi:hypothetical protein